MTHIKQFELDPSKEYVKIHGLQRAGTNYVACLINNFTNATALVNVGGWKHGPYCAPWVLGQETHVLTISKNPYAWLVSIYDYWKRENIGEDLTNKSFEDFVRGRAVFEKQQGVPYLMLAANPVRHWNFMNFHWLSIRMNTKQSLMLPYETLLLDSEGVMESLRLIFDLRKRYPEADVSFKIEPGEENPIPGKEVWDKQDYYLKKQYMDHYTPELIQFVNDELDKEVMNTIGYNFISI